jgi:hypothetical protein
MIIKMIKTGIKLNFENKIKLNDDSSLSGKINFIYLNQSIYSNLD